MARLIGMRLAQHSTGLRDSRQRAYRAAEMRDRNNAIAYFAKQSV